MAFIFNMSAFVYSAGYFCIRVVHRYVWVIFSNFPPFYYDAGWSFSRSSPTTTGNKKGNHRSHPINAPHPSIIATWALMGAPRGREDSYTNWKHFNARPMAVSKAICPPFSYHICRYLMDFGNAMIQYCWVLLIVGARIRCKDNMINAHFAEWTLVRFWEVFFTMEEGMFGFLQNLNYNRLPLHFWNQNGSTKAWFYDKILLFMTIIINLVKYFIIHIYVIRHFNN